MKRQMFCPTDIHFGCRLSCGDVCFTMFVRVFLNFLYHMISTLNISNHDALCQVFLSNKSWYFKMTLYFYFSSSSVLPRQTRDCQCFQFVLSLICICTSSQIKPAESLIWGLVCLFIMQLWMTKIVWKNSLTKIVLIISIEHWKL